MLMVHSPDLRAVELRIAPARVDDLPDLARWTALGQAAGEANPFFEPWFLTPAIAHLREGHEVWLAQGWSDLGRGPELVGLMPLAIHDRYGRMPARHVVNWAHYQCFMGVALVRDGWSVAWHRALLLALDDAAWAPGFLSLAGLEKDGPGHIGLVEAATSLGRDAPIVHKRRRAMLQSDLDGEAYLEAHVRAKKRKEWRRLSHRISELGTLVSSAFQDGDDLAEWCASFLTLEASGWKGERGAALANTGETLAFFHAMMAGAQAAGRLEFLRLDLNGQAIAMLINFRTPPASWSFKIAYDERLARYSPGVMIEGENLIRVLADPAVDWMDSCAVEDHPMINSLWAERRQIVQVSVPLAGVKRRATYALCRSAELSSARLRDWLGRKDMPA
jgi:CelD/BcsL family acetyltransferase involved in cellulose biosynthesis